ncbi:MAG: BamA/TamA family outer membrane protein [Alistipes sp.]|nr:BamA/TamA family outer membrane protein [Alistipes sp.]
MRRLLIVSLLCLCGHAFGAETRDSIYVNNADTIRYHYTPLTDTDSIKSDSAAAVAVKDTLPPKRNFFKRVIDYFGQSAVDKTFEKKMDFTIIGGPSYSSEKSLCLGVLAAGLYRIDRRDSITPPSNISLFGTVSINGFYSVGVSGNTFFRQGRHRLDYELAVQSEPTDFWGLGYYNGLNNAAGSYTGKKYMLDAKYMHAVFKNTYLGLTLKFNYTEAVKLSRPQYIQGQRRQYAGVAVGTFIEYDSRDVITFPTRGWYVSVHGSVQPKGVGNAGHTLFRAKTTLDFYQRVWKGGILCFDLYGEFNSAHTPWTMYATFGGSTRMRGYYEGRFNDLNMITLQVELRQRIWKRIGAVVWGGAGNVFRSFGSFEWEHTLPNYGVGLRWELKKHMNVRLDYGFGRKAEGGLINGFVMSINEAF